MKMHNFFDAIGVADMEKVHSAVIGWMLSDKCLAFSIETRSKLLQDIFEVKEQVKCFDSMTSYIEWKNIDILIVTSFCGKDECWLIENKIKSSQHSDQLNRYESIINCEYLLSSKRYPIYLELDDAEKEKRIKEWKPKINRFHSPQIIKHYSFLTLIDETPESSSWGSITYASLAHFVDSAISSSTSSNLAHRTFVNEYYDCINTLSAALTDFLENYTDYPNVFTDGEKTKEEKTVAELEKNERFASYICENGLETIFQKCFLQTIIPQTSFKKYKYSISETHGTALVDFRYADVNNVNYGFQFQNGSFKIQILGNEDATNFLNTRVEKLKTSYPDWKVNPSKEGKKPYLSLTKRSPKNASRRWFDKKVNPDIITTWNNACRECEELIKDIIENRT